jgi:hypothetical protein
MQETDTVHSRRTFKRKPWGKVSAVGKIFTLPFTAFCRVFRYEKSNVATEQSKILSALSCTKEVWLLNRYLQPVLTSCNSCTKKSGS